MVLQHEGHARATNVCNPFRCWLCAFCTIRESRTQRVVLSSYHTVTVAPFMQINNYVSVRQTVKLYRNSNAPHSLCSFSLPSQQTAMWHSFVCGVCGVRACVLYIYVSITCGHTPHMRLLAHVFSGPQNRARAESMLWGDIVFICIEKPHRKHPKHRRWQGKKAATQNPRRALITRLPISHCRAPAKLPFTQTGHPRHSVGMKGGLTSSVYYARKLK